MENIFKKNIHGTICYSMCVEGRIKDVKSCKSIEKLKAALKTEGLQKSVEKAINIQIRKLEKQK